MTLLRRLGYASVAIAFLHIVFGAIVRITGSGMGCGDHWPTCYGYWIPPFSRMDLVIEVSHRYLALLLLIVVAALAVAAWRRRAEPGIGGRGGVLRASGLALLLWIAPALLGALTVFLGNPPSATVAHKALAAALLAVLAVATIRAGGFGARALDGAPSTSKAKRGAWIAAAMAIVAVLLGALTAKLPGAAVACAGFPLCSETSGAPGLAHVQLTHRIVAYLLALHLVGLAITFARRREPRPLVLASRVGVALVLVQIALAGHMVLGGFPAAVRSAHQATGILIWLT
ncbi:MAG TPA: COX15/CtaA family protein, partial [Gemmatimonadaceae bacterium]